MESTMELIALAGLILGSSLTSGVNLYLTTAGLGIAHRFGWLTLPGDLEIISNPIIIGIAVVLYAIEFIADKVPYVDSAWDSVHTFIRPIGGAAIAYFATSDFAPVIQTATALAGGTLALDAHVTKATTRAAINTSPEPVTNSVASITEDAAVVGSLWLIIHHPIVICGLVVIFVLFSIWLIPKLFRFVKKVFLFLIGKKEESGIPTKTSESSPPKETS